MKDKEKNSQLENLLKDVTPEQTKLTDEDRAWLDNSFGQEWPNDSDRERKSEGKKP